MEERKKAPQFCRYCGSQLDPGALFCASCGVTVKRKVHDVEPVANTNEPDTNRERVESNVQQIKQAEDTDGLDVGGESENQNNQSYEEYGHKLFYGVEKDYVNSNNQEKKEAVEDSGDDAARNATVSNGGKKCIKCNFEMEEDMKFCPRCGASVTEASKENVRKKVCHACGKELKGTEEFCPFCGKQCSIDMPEQKRNIENYRSSAVNRAPEKRGQTGAAPLVLGIISIVIAVFSAAVLGWLGAILGIIGIILGANDRKNSLEGESGIATGGWVCSIIGTVLNLLFYVACLACASAVASL